MEPSEAGAARPVAAAADRPGELSASARGWHTIQMAVLGFIGICGVLRTTNSQFAALSGWWPAQASTAAVAVTSSSGQAWCGPLVNGPTGAISVRTGNGVITVPAQAIAQVRPVAQCP
jgi:hypothetical protein